VSVDLTADASYLDPATLAAVDRWVAYRTWHSRLPGAQVAIGLAGEVLMSRAYGFADVEQRIKMRDDHLFRIASHSKTFTATLILQLVEQGRLGLEDPVGAHLPELAAGVLGQVHLRELLEHTGGLLRDGLDADHWQFVRPFPDRDALLALVVDGGAKLDPGALFAYSNLGYSLLGLVVEAVTGQPFAQVTRERIVAPLGLADTSADYLATRADDYAVGYSGLHLATTRDPLSHVSTAAMDSATGFSSTARDLVRYFAAHRLGDERLLSDRSKRLQQRPANPIDPEHRDGDAYGLGMSVEEVDGRVYVGHGGGYPGHITKTLLDPETGLVVSVLTNASDGPAGPMARGIVELLQRAKQNAHAEGPSDGHRDSALLAWTGRYANLLYVMDVALLGGRLTTLGPTSWTPLAGSDQLEATGDGRLRIAAGSGTSSVGEFVTRDVQDGEVVSLRYGGLRFRPFPETVLEPTGD
jgi:D-alanyl-D-alanine carboxypeptidase